MAQRLSASKGPQRSIQSSKDTPETTNSRSLSELAGTDPEASKVQAEAFAAFTGMTYDPKQNRDNLHEMALSNDTGQSSGSDSDARIDRPAARQRKRKASQISKSTFPRNIDDAEDLSKDQDDLANSAPASKKPFKPTDEGSQKVFIDLTSDADDQIEIHSDDESGQPEILTSETAREYMKILANYVITLESYKSTHGNASKAPDIVRHIQAEMARLRDILMKQKPEFWNECKQDNTAGDMNQLVGVDGTVPNSRAVAADNAQSLEHRLEEAEKEKEKIRQGLLEAQMELERARQNEKSAVTVQYPATWILTSGSPSFNSIMGMLEVPPASEEHGAITTAFFETVPNHKRSKIEVVSIKRNQNPYIWNKYFANHVHIHNKNDGIAHEKFMWHGTEALNVDAILENGFDPRCSKEGGALGKGIYFAERAELSLTYTKTSRIVIGLPIPSGTYRLLYCRVLEGKACPGSRGLTRPPTINGSLDSASYDSCYGELSGSRTLCVFYDHQCYPEYVVDVKVESQTPEEVLAELLQVATAHVDADKWYPVVVKKAENLLNHRETEPLEVWGTVAILLSYVANFRPLPPKFGDNPSLAELSSIIKAQFRAGAIGPVYVPQIPRPLSDAVVDSVLRELNQAMALLAAPQTVLISLENLTCYKKMSAYEIKHAKTCTICLNDLVDGDAYRLGKCSGHGFHLSCLQTCYEEMSKPDTNFFKCPVCLRCYGERRGDQPKGGSMTYDIRSDIHLPGYEAYDTIVITYYFPRGVTTQGVSYTADRRVAYLPNDGDGRDILRRLHVAFERGLIFTVGTSVTTGMANTIVWAGIHHKTAISGGSAKHGYPDPTYLARVKKELEERGVE